MRREMPSIKFGRVVDGIEQTCGDYPHCECVELAAYFRAPRLRARDRARGREFEFNLHVCTDKRPCAKCRAG